MRRGALIALAAAALLLLAGITAPWGAFWPAPYADLNGATAGGMRLEVTGQPAAHRALVGACFGAPPAATVYLLVGVTAQNLPVNGGKLVPLPAQAFTMPAKASADGFATWTVPLLATPPTFYAQVMRRAGKITFLSNAVACVPGAGP